MKTLYSLILSKHDNGTFKGGFSRLREFLATASLLKVIKIAFFHLKSSFDSQDI